MPKNKDGPDLDVSRQVKKGALKPVIKDLFEILTKVKNEYVNGTNTKDTPLNAVIVAESIARMLQIENCESNSSQDNAGKVVVNIYSGNDEDE